MEIARGLPTEVECLPRAHAGGPARLGHRRHLTIFPTAHWAAPPRSGFQTPVRRHVSARRVPGGDRVGQWPLQWLATRAGPLQTESAACAERRRH